MCVCVPNSTYDFMLKPLIWLWGLNSKWVAGKEGGNYQKDGKVELSVQKKPWSLLNIFTGTERKGLWKFDSKEPAEAIIRSFSKTWEYILSILKKIGSQVKDFKIIVQHNRRGVLSFIGIQDGLMNQSWQKQASPGERASCFQRLRIVTG